MLEQAEKLCDEIVLLAKSKKILEGNLKELKRRRAAGELRLAHRAPRPAEVASMPGVASVAAVNGEYVVSLSPGTDRREFLRRALDRTTWRRSRSAEPELEEIYLSAVREAGMEETRTIE